ncbi:MAG: Glutathione peroxidase 7 [Geoglossum simile]|nr:MAG: Glutathione peroxidase 7 [Geoglossum simile]
MLSFFSPPASSPQSFYSLSHPDSRGQPFRFSSLKGKVVLLVNTASGCGYTPQYTSLEKLYHTLSTTYPDQFIVLGFPSNQFLGQEPLSDAQIQTFCTRNHGVTFPVLAKSNVNGSHENEVWKWLKEQKPGMLGLRRVKWNFEKFLVGRDGNVVGRWASTTTPESLEEVILRELKKATPPKETSTENGKAVEDDHPKSLELENAQNGIHRSEL